MREREVIERLRRIATAPEARGLRDDVAVLDGLVITHDSIAEGVHFLEANVAPGMTETSLFPQAAAAAGLTLGKVAAALIARH